MVLSGVANLERDREAKPKLYSLRGARERWIAAWRGETISFSRRENGRLPRAMTLTTADRPTSPSFPVLPGWSGSSWVHGPVPVNSSGEPDRSSPIGQRLSLPRGYRVAAGNELLPWSDVVRRLAEARNYWLATVRPDGRPHVTPVWGAWLDDAFYFDGIFTSRWARNLGAKPAATVHLESGVEVVILEGRVEDVVPDAVLAARIVEAYAAKYVAPLPRAEEGMYCLRPRVVRAWTRWPDDATRWSFPAKR